MHNKMVMDYRVLLYYKFVQIDDPQAMQAEHQLLCDELGLKGRILIATEGINGTVSGLREQTDAYKAYMYAHPLFADIEFKEDKYDQHAFLKMHVRAKEEVIRFDVGEIDPTSQVGKYIEPEEFQEVLERAETDEDIIILDTRSDYEFKVGKFKHAKTLDINTFRDLPEKLQELETYKDKKIYTYCTGGIRCEKVTLWMENQGFEHVYQLHGGIVNYGKVTGGKDFEGECYVFDQRVVVPVNEVNPSVIGSCDVCGGATEKIINCANADCNKHFLICEACAERLDGCCSESCSTSPKKRQFDGKGYYLRGVNSKEYSSS